MQGRARTTEQIAAAGAPTEGHASSDGQLLPDTQADQMVPARQGAAQQDTVAGVPGTGDQPRARLLEEHELQDIMAQWKEIQAAFVDEPKQAVQDADALVAELMQRLAQMFATERQQLESRWAGGDDVSTEDLRHGLRRYRSFFERLLAA
jgi:hypothetical protein